MKPFSQHKDPLSGDSACLSVDTIHRYLTNKADIAGDHLEEITAGLNRRLREKYAYTGREKGFGAVSLRSRRPLLMAAASLVLLAGMATLLYFFFSLPQQITIPANENNGLAAAGEVKKEETKMTSGPVSGDTGKRKVMNGITVVEGEKAQPGISELPAGETADGSRPEVPGAKEGLPALADEPAERDLNRQTADAAIATAPETQIIIEETIEYMPQPEPDQTASVVADHVLDEQAVMAAGETKFAAKRSSGKSYTEGLKAQPVQEDEPAVPAEEYQEPVFPGGEDSLQVYFMRNFIVPAEAAMAENDSICIRFIVATDGSLGKLQILQGAGKGMDAEIKRLFNGMPPWLPASSGGLTVAAAKTLMLRFSENTLLLMVNGKRPDVLQP